jgi:hypothetical protein
MTYMDTNNLRQLEKHLDDFTSGFTVPTYRTYLSGERPNKRKRAKSSRPQYKN